MWFLETSSTVFFNHVINKRLYFDAVGSMIYFFDHSFKTLQNEGSDFFLALRLRAPYSRNQTVGRYVDHATDTSGTNPVRPNHASTFAFSLVAAISVVKLKRGYARRTVTETKKRPPNVSRTGF